ncbi:response regulator transcription factor [Plesiomonas shigelloides]|uniref:Response regulator transcription factor n=1 Tax=Plesiomonas shigelloides TaxID=703 RepID=A0A8I1W5D8_PLESH|nr:response regulator transcription factor [Plesiomonas shigelloides]MBO1107753.1 response regulator transcription factor [Plesiomonas shigelloides]
MDSAYTLLIADDHPLFRAALHQALVLSVSSAELFEADSLDSLLQLLEQHPDPDLLLLDLKMPGANGFSGLQTLRQRYPLLPIVVISASDDPAIIQQVRQHGALGFIPKSAQLSVLIDAIGQALAGDTIFPADLDSLAPQPDPQTRILQERLSSLTAQQQRVLEMLSAGLLNKQIAYDLNVSEATVKAHMTAIFRKLGVKNRTQAVILLQQSELKSQTGL